MKKIIALLMTLVMLFCFAACGDADTNSKSSDTDKPAAKSDLEYIQDKGKLVVGMTVYEPMNYKDDKGEWTGFDTEFAQAVAKKLDLDVEFVVIDWDNKWPTLNSKKIDVVWNGMTLSEEAKTNASCSNPYVLNAQVVVMKKDKIEEYKTADSMKKLNFAVEAGSAGKDIADENGFKFTEYTAQSDAMSAVKTNKADACIIDITMANAMTGEGTSFSDLGVGISLTEEEYAIACRKNSDFTAKLNDIMAELKADGTLTALAEKYSVTLAD
ncbi:MAG: transporter substrate-binding domain-containing protein [Ruminococcaceae bacterium]|nr:transporter substrate-binding domain-containing protein [Oscillospiraceae bacterium]